MATRTAHLPVEEGLLWLFLLGLTVGSGFLAQEVGSATQSPSVASVDELGAPARRIVSANLTSDEILLALVPTDRIVALSVFADDTTISNVIEKAQAVPTRVWAYPERLLSLDPDVIFSFPFARPEATHLLGQVGVPVVNVGYATSVSDVLDNIRLVGRVTGEKEAAEALVDRTERRLQEVKGRAQGATRTPVLLYVWGGYTAGTGTLFDELVRAAGGENVAAEAGMAGSPALPAETLLELDPETIFVIEYEGDAKARSVFRHTSLKEIPAFKTLRAVRDGRVYSLPARHALSTSQYAVETAWDIGRALHPARFGR